MASSSSSPSAINRSSLGESLLALVPTTSLSPGRRPSYSWIKLKFQMNQKCQWQKGWARLYGCNPGDLCMIAERLEAPKTSKWAEGRKRSHFMPFHCRCYFTLKPIQMSARCCLFIKSGSVPPSASISRPEGVKSDSIQISQSCTLLHFNQSIIDRNWLSPPPTPFPTHKSWTCHYSSSILTTW